MKRQAGLGASATPCRNPLASFGWSPHQVLQPKEHNTASQWWSTLPVEVCFQKPFNSLGAPGTKIPRLAGILFVVDQKNSPSVLEATTKHARH